MHVVSAYTNGGYKLKQYAGLAWRNKNEGYHSIRQGSYIAS